MPRYVSHSFIRPAQWPSAALEEGWFPHVEGVLRRQAIDDGLTLTGTPEQEGLAIPVKVETDDGPVDCLSVVYRAEAEAPGDISESSVEAVETEPGVWAADLPLGVAIVSVRHGLDSFSVDVDGLDVTGRSTGYRSFVPVSPGEVEIVPGLHTKRVRITIPDPAGLDEDA